MVPTPAAASVLDDLPFSFARATLAFRRISDETLQVVGLDSLAPGLASVMHGIDELGSCTVNALIEKTHLPNGTLTGLLDVLERDGYVRRARNPDDGRSWILELTQGGRLVCKKLKVRHLAVMAMLRQVLTDAESVKLGRLLEKLTSHMRNAAVESGAGTKVIRTPSKPRRARTS